MEWIQWINGLNGRLPSISINKLKPFSCSTHCRDTTHQWKLSSNFKAQSSASLLHDLEAFRYHERNSAGSSFHFVSFFPFSASKSIYSVWVENCENRIVTVFFLRSIVPRIGWGVRTTPNHMRFQNHLKNGGPPVSGKAVHQLHRRVSVTAAMPRCVE